MMAAGPKTKRPGLIRRLIAAVRSPAKAGAPPRARRTAAFPVRPTSPKVAHLAEAIGEIVQARRDSYRAATNPRNRNKQGALGGSGDSHADAWTRRLTRELSRDLDRNAGAYATIGDKIETWQVGAGVRYRATTADPTWNQRASELVHQRMLLIKGGLDARGLCNGYGLQRFIARQLSVDGDLGVLKLKDWTVQILESDQIAGSVSTTLPGSIGMTWSLHEGVQLSAGGKVEFINACPYNPDTGVVMYDQAEAYGPDELMYAALRNRHSQTRGMPDMTPVLDDFERGDSYLESETIAAEISSQIWITLNYREGVVPQQAFTPDDPLQNETEVRGGLKADGTVDWQPTTAGSALVCPDGMEGKPFNPQRPNVNAEPFLIFLMRQHCAKVGYAYELVFDDLRGMSWSTAKSLIDMSNATTEARQLQHLAPIFSGMGTFVLWGLIQEGQLPLRDDWDAHEMEWPRMEYPDPEKFFSANQLGFQTGQISRVQVLGAKAFKTMTELAIEREHACMLARALNKQYPEFPTTPEHFLGGMQAGAPPPVEKPEDAGATKKPEEQPA